ncbi:hypothetical protein [Streptomyces sp. NBC_01565]|uniref:DUF6907 domain-containing protein n=1 Tax=Streptomyces sp. NBC_01565 TaxID=2975881 RepID=UPI002250F1DA|nr:hypothetical protein [Streptomyces sp. NBC_01565]MCX4541443.1 hypothetical protein [Streptomyces sp. NBC_01565]
MNAPHIVSVRTVDHGVVDLPEPSWCAGGHRDDVNRADIHHEGTEHAASVDIPGTGRVPFLTAFLSQYPFAEHGSRRVTVAVEIEGEHIEFDPAGLGDLAAAITAHALYGLLPLRARLQSLQDGE